MATRSELLCWVKEITGVECKALDEFRSGELFLNILKAYHPQQVPVHRIVTNAKFEHQFLRNFKIFQEVTQSLGIQLNTDFQKIFGGSPIQIIDVLRTLHSNFGSKASLKPSKPQPREPKGLESQVTSPEIRIKAATPDVSPSTTTNATPSTAQPAFTTEFRFFHANKKNLPAQVVATPVAKEEPKPITFAVQESSRSSPLQLTRRSSECTPVCTRRISECTPNCTPKATLVSKPKFCSAERSRSAPVSNRSSNSSTALLTNLSVCVRIRPHLKSEKGSSLWVVDGNTIHSNSDTAEGKQPSSSASEKPSVYTFDNVFSEGSSTVDIYSKVCKKAVEMALQGISASVFAYGATCSGKTFTIGGEARSPGIIELAAKDLFEFIQQRLTQSGKNDVNVTASYLELYNEQLCDLLQQSAPVTIRENPNGSGVILDSLSRHNITSAADVLNLRNRGETRRHVDINNRHAHASRSHTVFQLRIEQSQFTTSPVKISSVLNIIDLAGSESSYIPTSPMLFMPNKHSSFGLPSPHDVKAKQEAVRRNLEGNNIRCSLLALIRVVRTLAERASRRMSVVGPCTDALHIPYRDSKLTRVLAESIGGNSYSVFICTLSPCDLQESVSTLHFATVAQLIRGSPKPVTTQLSAKEAVARYQSELTRIMADLEAERKEKEALLAKEKEKDQVIQSLESQYQEVKKQDNLLRELESQLSQKESELETYKQLSAEVKRRVEELTTQLNIANKKSDSPSKTKKIQQLKEEIAKLEAKEKEHCKMIETLRKTKAGSTPVKTVAKPVTPKKPATPVRPTTPVKPQQVATQPSSSGRSSATKNRPTTPAAATTPTATATATTTATVKTSRSADAASEAASPVSSASSRREQQENAKLRQRLRELESLLQQNTTRSDQSKTSEKSSNRSDNSEANALEAERLRKQINELQQDLHAKVSDAQEKLQEKSKEIQCYQQEVQTLCKEVAEAETLALETQTKMENHTEKFVSEKQRLLKEKEALEAAKAHAADQAQTQERLAKELQEERDAMQRYIEYKKSKKGVLTKVIRKIFRKESDTQDDRATQPWKRFLSPAAARSSSASTRGSSGVVVPPANIPPPPLPPQLLQPQTQPQPRQQQLQQFPNVNAVKRAPLRNSNYSNTIATPSAVTTTKATTSGNTPMTMTSAVAISSRPISIIEMLQKEAKEKEKEKDREVELPPSFRSDASRSSACSSNQESQSNPTGSSQSSGQASGCCSLESTSRVVPVYV